MKHQRKIIKRKHNQRGFTLVELITCIVGLAGFGIVGWLLYALVHFALKFW